MLAVVAAIAVFVAALVLFARYVLPYVAAVLLLGVIRLLPQGSGTGSYASAMLSSLAILAMLGSFWILYRLGVWFFGRRAVSTREARRGPRALWLLTTLASIAVAASMCGLSRVVPLLESAAAASTFVAAGMVGLAAGAAGLRIALALASAARRLSRGSPVRGIFILGASAGVLAAATHVPPTSESAGQLVFQAGDHAGDIGAITSSAARPIEFSECMLQFLGPDAKCSKAIDTVRRRLVRSRLLACDEAEDAIRTLVVDTCTHADDNPCGYFTTGAIYKLIKLTKQSRRWQRCAIDEVPERQCPIPSAADLVFAKEVRAVVLRVFETLSPKDKEILGLVLENHMTYAEAAKHIGGIGADAARVRFDEALVRWIVAIQEQCPPLGDLRD